MSEFVLLKMVRGVGFEPTNFTASIEIVITLNLNINLELTLGAAYLCVNKTELKTYVL